MNEIFNDNKKMKSFIEFCKKCDSYENIKFIIDVNSFKINKKKQKNFYKQIMKDFFSDKSIYHLNVDIELLNKIKKSKICEDMFDEIYKEIYTMLNNDIYYRYTKNDNNKTENKNKRLSVYFFNNIEKKNNVSKKTKSLINII